MNLKLFCDLHSVKVIDCEPNAGAWSTAIGMTIARFAPEIQFVPPISMRYSPAQYDFRNWETLPVGTNLAYFDDDGVFLCRVENGKALHKIKKIASWDLTNESSPYIEIFEL